MEQTGFDPKRRLCPDGSCLGLISTDGRCTVCGRTAAAAAAGQQVETDVDQGVDHDSWADAASGADTHDSAAIGGLELSAGFDPKRRLCEDGSCVGVIGPDGACTVCGMKTAG